MSVIIRPVREAVELTVGKALNARVLSRPMIAEIVAAGVNAIEANPIGYLTYYNTRAGTGSVVLTGIEDHIEQLHRAGQRASAWIHSRHINVTTGNDLMRTYGINEFLLGHTVAPKRPVPPRTPAHPEQLGPAAAAKMGYRWLTYAKALDLWRKSANDAEIQHHQKLAHEAVTALLTDAFGPWLGH